jgi:hypothetical protein
VRSEKAAQWGSLRSFEKSMRAWDEGSRPAEERKEWMAQRRARLQALLEAEREGFLLELQAQAPRASSSAKVPLPSGKKKKKRKKKGEKNAFWRTVLHQSFTN